MKFIKDKNYLHKYLSMTDKYQEKSPGTYFGNLFWIEYGFRQCLICDRDRFQ